MLITPLTRGSSTKLRPVMWATALTTASMSALTRLSVPASSAARAGAARSAAISAAAARSRWVGVFTGAGRRRVALGPEAKTASPTVPEAPRRGNDSMGFFALFPSYGSLRRNKTRIRTGTTDHLTVQFHDFREIPDATPKPRPEPAPHLPHAVSPPVLACAFPASSTRPSAAYP